MSGEIDALNNLVPKYARTPGYVTNSYETVLRRLQHADELERAVRIHVDSGHDQSRELENALQGRKVDIR